MKGSLADFHQEMNAMNFKKWFEDKLLPALPANSLIVMNNASYHSMFCIHCKPLLLVTLLLAYKGVQKVSAFPLLHQSSER